MKNKWSCISNLSRDYPVRFWKLTLSFSIVILICLLPFANGTLNAQSLNESLDSYLEKQIYTIGIPGFCVAVVKDGKVIYSHAFGVRALGKDEPLTTENIFHFASVSKTFTATALMQLVEKGLLDLDKPLTTYLPYFHLADERYKDITIREITNHTSGMTRTEDLEWDKPQYDVGAAERYVRSLSNDTLQSTPGEHYFYTDKAVDMMADLVAKVSGMPFEEYIKENIFEPLGMDHSSFIYPEIDTTLRTTGHIGNPAQPNYVYPYNRAHAPSSTLNSNVLDMSRWMIANLNRGEIDGHRILKSKSYKVLWEPSTRVDVMSELNSFQREHFIQYLPITHGINWYLGQFQGHFVVFHAGGDTGFRSFELLFPDDMIGIVVASNWDHTPTPELSAGIAGIVLKQTEK